MVVCCKWQEENIKYTLNIDDLWEGGIPPIFFWKKSNQIKKEGKITLIKLKVKGKVR